MKKCLNWTVIVILELILCAISGPKWQQWSSSTRSSHNNGFIWGQHFTDRCIVLSLRLRRHRHWRCRDRSRRLESPVDDLPPQGLCSHCHGHCSPPNDPKPPLVVKRCLLLCFRNLEPHRHRDRNRNRCHDTRCGCRLDLCHLHGAGLWSVHLCVNKPPAFKGILTKGCSCGWQSQLQVCCSAFRYWGYSCCDDLGHLIHKYKWRMH